MQKEQQPAAINTICIYELSRNDPNNYYKSPEELLEAFRNIVENIVEPHLLEIFQTKPETKLIIKGKEGVKITPQKRRVKGDISILSTYITSKTFYFGILRDKVF